MGFLPGGDTLLWQDQHGCVHRADYDMWNWSDELRPVLNNKACGGSLTATPNGLGLIHWRSGTPGVTVYLDEGRVLLHQATD